MSVEISPVKARETHRGLAICCHYSQRGNEVP